MKLHKLYSMAGRLLDGLDSLALRGRPYILFTSINTILRVIDKRSQSILDVGCGKGVIMGLINKTKRFYTVGVDIFEPSLRKAKKEGIHDDYILSDVRSLPFSPKSFDTVLCSQVLEHLEKKEGGKLVESLERIARLQVIISTPVGICKQHAYDENPWQEHRSTWTPADMRRLGYKVRGLGLSIPLTNKIQAIIGPLVYLQIMIGPLVYFLPRLAGNMVCVKSRLAGQIKLGKPR